MTRANVIIPDSFSYGDEPAYIKDRRTKCWDVIYNPNPEKHPGMYGLLARIEMGRGIGSENIIPPWNNSLIGNVLNHSNLPDCVLMGPKDLAGGRGLKICNEPANIGNYINSVGATGAMIVEDQLRNEQYFQSPDDQIPDISIRYMTFFSQGYCYRPGGDGSTLHGLVRTLTGYNEGWINKNMPEMTVDGRCGGWVNESPTSENLGLEYDIQACRIGKTFDISWVKTGLENCAKAKVARCFSHGDIMTAIASGHIVFGGGFYSDNMGHVDSEGFCTRMRYGERGCVAIEICGYYLSSRARYGHKLWYLIKMPWGKSWGFDGFALIPFRDVIFTSQYGVNFPFYAFSINGCWENVKSFNYLKSQASNYNFDPYK